MFVDVWVFSTCFVYFNIFCLFVKVLYFRKCLNVLVLGVWICLYKFWFWNRLEMLIFILGTIWPDFMIPHDFLRRFRYFSPKSVPWGRFFESVGIGRSIFHGGVVLLRSSR